MRCLVDTLGEIILPGITCFDVVMLFGVARFPRHLLFFAPVPHFYSKWSFILRLLHLTFAYICIRRGSTAEAPSLDTITRTWHSTY